MVIDLQAILALTMYPTSTGDSGGGIQILKMLVEFCSLIHSPPFLSIEKYFEERAVY